MDEQAFERVYSGRLHGVLRWPQWQALCERISAGSSPWYFYALDLGPPVAPLRGEVLRQALADLDLSLRELHAEDYFGLAYVDDADDPGLVKIYHPRRMGSVCGSSGVVTLPAWVLSRYRPVDLSPPPAVKSWWGRLRA